MRLDLIQIGGVHLPALLIFIVLAVLVYLPLRWLLHRLRFHRFVWHPALVEAACYAAILASLLLWLGP